MIGRAGAASDGRGASFRMRVRDFHVLVMMLRTFAQQSNGLTEPSYRGGLQLGLAGVSPFVSRVSRLSLKALGDCSTDPTA